MVDITTQLESPSSFAKISDEKEDIKAGGEENTPVLLANVKSVKFSDVNETRYFNAVGMETPIGKEIWYSDGDYRKMSEKSRKLARKFLKGSLVEGTYKRHTYRGLEEFDEETFGARMNVFVESTEAVINEQIRQRKIGITDPIAIANAYCSGGATVCQEEAVARGEEDYETSIKCVADDYRKSSKKSSDMPAFDAEWFEAIRLKIDAMEADQKHRRKSMLKSTGKSLKNLLSSKNK